MGRGGEKGQREGRKRLGEPASRSTLYVCVCMCVWEGGGGRNGDGFRGKEVKKSVVDRRARMGGGGLCATK